MIALPVTVLAAGMLGLVYFNLATIVAALAGCAGMLLPSMWLEWKRHQRHRAL